MSSIPQPLLSRLEVPVATRLGKIRLTARMYPKPSKPRLTRLKLELCKPRLRQLIGLKWLWVASKVTQNCIPA